MIDRAPEWMVRAPPGVRRSRVDHLSSPTATVYNQTCGLSSLHQFLSLNHQTCKDRKKYVSKTQNNNKVLVQKQQVTNKNNTNKINKQDKCIVSVGPFTVYTML